MSNVKVAARVVRGLSSLVIAFVTVGLSMKDVLLIMALHVSVAWMLVVVLGCVSSVDYLVWMSVFIRLPDVLSSVVRVSSVGSLVLGRTSNAVRIVVVSIAVSRRVWLEF